MGTFPQPSATSCVLCPRVLPEASRGGPPAGRPHNPRLKKEGAGLRGVWWQSHGTSVEGSLDLGSPGPRDLPADGQQPGVTHLRSQGQALAWERLRCKEDRTGIRDQGRGADTDPEMSVYQSESLNPPSHPSG